MDTAVGSERKIEPFLARVRRMLPTGDTLSCPSWKRRHRAITALLWAHLPLIVVVGTVNGHGLAHSSMEAALVAVFALGATLAGYSIASRSVFATVGLMSCSAILTHLTGGLIEMHFHFFVMVAVVTLYQSWRPFGVAIAFVLLHHAVIGGLDAASVFNHPSALAHPWKWAMVHALFIAGESIACLVAWRLNEDALQGERAARGELQSAIDDLAEAQQIARIGSWEWNTTTGSLWWSDENYRIYGYEPQSVEPTLQLALEATHPDDRVLMASTLERSYEDVDNFELTYRVVHPDGTVVVVHALGHASKDGNGDVRAVGTCQDVTRQKALEEQIEHRAFHDALTGLANRALFLNRVEHALERRDKNPTSVLFLDLDDFKSVNDSAGHAGGDELLIECGRRLKSIVRPSDTTARLGGDEFAILLEDGDAATATEIARRILDAMQVPFEVDSHELLIHASIGIAVADEGASPDDLLRDADIAMYAAKSRGKNDFDLCNPAMRESVVARLALKTELRRAIDNEEFVLHFQPIVDLASKRLVAVEALVRWEHPERGLVPPMEFIPVAEEMGLIVPLGSWVLREATKNAVELQRLSGKTFSLSVNLSTQQLQPAIVAEVANALEDSGLEAKHLIVEITESVLMDNREASGTILQSLRDLGVQVAVDDFGTGYSSLSYLQEFPLDILKIDRSFVARITEGPEEAALAQAVIKLASILNLRTVAEGIETSKQQSSLEALGCRTGQGYLFSKPLSVSDLNEWLGSGALRRLSNIPARPRRAPRTQPAIVPSPTIQFAQEGSRTS